MSNAQNQSASAHVPFGDPAALGLTGFALTTFVLSVINAGWFPASITGVVLGLAIFYGGIGQVIAGIWEFANRNTFGAVAFTSYGAFWLAFYFYATNVLPNLDASVAGSATGLFLLAWGIFTLYMTFAALKVSNVVLAVFIALTITFFLLAFGEFAGNSTLHMIGGYVGILTAVLAWYGAFAAVMNATFKKKVIPVGPRS